MPQQAINAIIKMKCENLIYRDFFVLFGNEEKKALNLFDIQLTGV